jgi:type II secretory ATPase GspE/PulE/Tfp pilus assembly ATPase PilB-like protein
MGDDPVVITDNLLRSAFLRHSSDIHFDPEANSLRVRFRTDGELEDVVRLPVSIQAALTSRLKVLSGMDIAERRAPQDGAFTWQMTTSIQQQSSIDVRMATLPVRHGERITLRLLESENEKLSLGRLGFSSADEQIFKEVLSQPHGLVLLTGPTGSGKTTTLYAAIKSLMERSPLNILTVEDPIEYEIEGVSQAEVDSSDKVNFSKALKSLLRHDPDVIMIGEIRDRESLDIAVKAALTGHLVLSTLHTNDAVSAVSRLADMGLEAHLAAATLRLSVAQRLVRALCPKCAKACAVDEMARALFGIEEKDCPNVYSPSGCLSCAGRGYRGRLGTFEMFRPDREISSMIAKGESENEIFAAACRKGMRTLKDDLKDKCFSALTTVSEAAKVLGGIY